MSGSFLLLFSPTSLNFKNVASRRASSILLPLIQPRKHFQTATTTSLSPSQFFRQPRFLNFSVVGRIVRRFAPVARSVSRIKRREKETRKNREKGGGKEWRKAWRKTARLTGAPAPRLSLTSPRNAQTLETIGCE